MNLFRMIHGTRNDPLSDRTYGSLAVAKVQLTRMGRQYRSLGYRVYNTETGEVYRYDPDQGKVVQDKSVRYSFARFQILPIEPVDLKPDTRPSSPQEVYDLIQAGRMTLQEFENWVNDECADAFGDGLETEP